MRRLVLFRHGKAVPPDGDEEDFDRALVPEGREAAAGMAGWLDEQGIVPDLVVCSSALRTRQTWDAARRAFDPEPPVIFEELVYEASAEILLEIVRSADGEIQTLMIVGHNPAMESVAAALADSAEPDVAARFEEKFPTAAIAVLDFEDIPWGAIEEKTAWMFAFETPKSQGLKE